MKIINLSNNINKIADLVACIGFFDGLHLGHFQLVNKTASIGKEKKLKTALITFNHSPKFILNPQEEEVILTSIEDRAQLLEGIIDYLLVIDFTPKTARLSPKQFIDQILLPLGVVELVCGYDFRFGFKGAGKGENVKELSEDKIKTTIIEPYLINKEKVASSTIHNLITQGDFLQANLMLGCDYQIKGRINLNGDILLKNNYRLPKNGQYLVQINNDRAIIIIIMGNSVKPIEISKISDIINTDVKITFLTKGDEILR